MPGVMRHLGRYYEKMGRVPPWEEKANPEPEVTTQDSKPLDGHLLDEAIVELKKLLEVLNHG